MLSTKNIMQYEKLKDSLKQYELNVFEEQELRAEPHTERAYI